MKNRFGIWFTLLLLSGIWSCGEESRNRAADDSGAPLQIVATTGMITDALAEVAGEYATVEALMGPGVDPHLYKAAQGDLKKLTQADAIFYNGLHLEGKMGEILSKLARMKPVVAVADSLPNAKLINSTDYASAYDPHVWFDVALWAEVAGIMGEAMAEIDPAHAAAYRSNAQAYQEELQSLHQWVAAQISAIPEKQRVLITAHDAFEYFGRAYGIQVRGLQGISTVSEYGLRDVTELVDFITSRGIKAVFVESSVPSKALEAVVEGAKRQGHMAKIGGTLYSDAMGAAGTPAGTYPGMVRANVETITKALK